MSILKLTLTLTLTLTPKYVGAFSCQFEIDIDTEICRSLFMSI
jgi:hypothetical protein